MKTHTPKTREEVSALSKEIWEMVQAHGSVNVVFTEKPLQAEEVDIETSRTSQQRKALEVFCRKVSEAFNNAGLSMNVILQKRSKREIRWTQESVKEVIWRNIQRAMTGKESSAKLTTKEMQDIYEVVNNSVLAEEGIHVPFPSRFTQMETEA